MEIRFSPYNSPFSPSEPVGVYWIGAEYRNAPHSAHVAAHQKHLGSLHVQFVAYEKIADRDLQRLKQELREFRDALHNGHVLQRSENFRIEITPKKKISARGFKAKQSIAQQKKRNV